MNYLNRSFDYVMFDFSPLPFKICLRYVDCVVVFFHKNQLHNQDLEKYVFAPADANSLGLLKVEKQRVIKTLTRQDALDEVNRFKTFEDI